MKKSGSEIGFTLVELAIILVVIGILLGGILKGREIRDNARITALATQISRYDAAIINFKNLYGQLPGDIPHPTRLTNCSGYCATAGNGDGRIFHNNAANFTVSSANSENIRIWIHLQRADLMHDVSADTNSTTPNRGVNYPAGPFRGSIIDIHFNATHGSNLPETAHYAKIINASSPSTEVMTQKQVGAFDIKTDDSSPRFGRVIGWRNGGAAFCNSGGSYDISSTSVRCNLSVRMNF